MKKAGGRAPDQMMEELMFPDGRCLWRRDPIMLEGKG